MEQVLKNAMENVRMEIMKKLPVIHFMNCSIVPTDSTQDSNYSDNFK